MKAVSNEKAMGKQGKISINRVINVATILLVLSELFYNSYITDFLKEAHNNFSVSDAVAPNKKTIDENMDEDISSRRVHIVQAADNGAYKAAIMTSIRSIVKSTPTPELVTIHIFVHKKPEAEKDDDNLEEYKKDFGFVSAEFGAQLELHEYSYDDVEPFINKRNVIEKKQHLLAPQNYVRFILPEHLPPSVKSCLWMDADTAVTRDIVPFLQRYGHEKAVAAVARDQNPTSYKEDVRDILRENGVDLAEPLPSFNAGIMVMNLEYWRKHEVGLQIRQICDLNSQYNLYPKFGSQPPLVFLFSGDRFEPVDPKLVVGDLGHKDGLEEAIGLNTTLFLHWDGKQKPWLEDGNYKDVWEKYT